MAHLHNRGYAAIMIGIRADANEHIGMGHVMRCMSIAIQLNKLGHEVLFIVSDESAYQAVKARRFDCVCLHNRYDEKENELEDVWHIILEHNINVLLLDSYVVTEKYMSSLKECTKIVYIDDIKAFVYPVDMLINYIIGAGSGDYPEQEYIDNNTCFLFGGEYIPLRPEFDSEPISINENVRRILITTGGMDEGNMILGLLYAMRRKPEFTNVEKIIVAGKYYEKLDELLAVQGSENNITVYHDVSDMCSLMRQCDMAISAGGTTLAELAACGVPTVSFSVADNQISGSISYDKEGIVIYAGDVRKDRVAVINAIIDKVTALMANQEARVKLSMHAKKTIDGKGAYRLAREIASLEQHNISFLDLLLDETLCAGEVRIPRDLVISAGGINTRLTAKRKYELLLRIAHESADGALRYAVDRDGRMIISYNRGNDDCEECNKTSDQDNYITIDDEAPTADGWKTDCYLIGRYSADLKENDVFDDAVSQILAEAGEGGRYNDTVAFLEHMISQDETYWHIDEGSRPILIYKGDDVCHNVLNVFAEQFGAALARRGKNIIYFDAKKQELSELTEFMYEHFQAIIGVQTYIFTIKMEDGIHYLHEYISGPKYNFQFDHPIWARPHLLHHFPDFHLLTLDQNYVEFVKRYFGKDAILFPPAGMTVASESPIESGTGYICSAPIISARQGNTGINDLTDRPYDLTFVGTLGNWRALACEIHELPRDKRFIANRFLLMMRKDPNMTAEQALAEVLLAKYGKVLPDEDFRELLYELRRIIYCVMHYYREKVLDTILGAGIRLDVFGDSWQKSPLEHYGNLVIHPNVTVEESLEIFNRSKLSLNIMSWHKGGFTERMANVMLAGAVLVTDYTTYLNGRFDDEDMVIFRLDELSGLPEKIKAVLSDEDLRERIALSGQKKTLAGHTWDKRAEEFIDILNT